MHIRAFPLIDSLSHQLGEGISVSQDNALFLLEDRLSWSESTHERRPREVSVAESELQRRHAAQVRTAKRRIYRLFFYNEV